MLRRTGWVAVVGGAEDGILVFGHVGCVSWRVGWRRLAAWMVIEALAAMSD